MSSRQLGREGVDQIFLGKLLDGPIEWTDRRADLCVGLVDCPDNLVVRRHAGHVARVAETWITSEIHAYMEGVCGVFSSCFR